jgi:hypothetical protein
MDKYADKTDVEKRLTAQRRDLYASDKNPYEVITELANKYGFDIPAENAWIFSPYVPGEAAAASLGPSGGGVKPAAPAAPGAPASDADLEALVDAAVKGG